MKQEEIDYIDIINLGFEVEVVSDTQYFKKYGYEYCIITKWLVKNKIYLDWTKDKRFCKMVRVDSKMNILNEMPIKNLDQLKICINFFCEKKKENQEFIDYTNFA